MHRRGQYRNNDNIGNPVVVLALSFFLSKPRKWGSTCYRFKVSFSIAAACYALSGPVSYLLHLCPHNRQIAFRSIVYSAFQRKITSAVTVPYRTVAYRSIERYRYRSGSGSRSRSYHIILKAFPSLPICFPFGGTQLSL